MDRVPFSEIIKEAKVDINKEYSRLFQLFFFDDIQVRNDVITLYDACAEYFANYPFRGTCLTLDDYCETHNLNFVESPSNFDINYLVSFCEFVYNFITFRLQYTNSYYEKELQERGLFLCNQVQRVTELIGYTANRNGGVTDFVPKDAASISVAEILDQKLSYKVIEYNHHSMKGNIEKKKLILKLLGDKLEPDRKKLGAVNKELRDSIFIFLNNLNIRHNNVEGTGSKFHSTVATMSVAEIEAWYDDLYQMILLAFLELDHLNRKPRIDELSKKLEEDKK